MKPSYGFTGHLWEYQGEAPWVFITVPVAAAEDIRERVGSFGGFGSVKVEVTIGDSTWNTSLFPDRESGSFVLPVKKDIRRSEGLAVGDEASVTLTVESE